MELLEESFILKAPAGASSELRPTSRRSDGGTAAAEPRRGAVLPAVGDRGAEHVQVHLDHHQPQGLRRDPVPGGAPRRRGGPEGAGGRRRHRELRGRGTLDRRQRDGGRHGDRRGAPGRPAQAGEARGNSCDDSEGRQQLVV